MRFLNDRDVVDLLRIEVHRAGSQMAWAAKTGVHRTIVNKILSGEIAPTKQVIIRLGLRVVYIPKANGLDREKRARLRIKSKRAR